MTAGTQDRELVMSSYLRWVPRATPLAVLAALFFVARRLFRLTAAPGVDLRALRERLTRIDTLLFRPPRWLRQQWVQADGVPARWIRDAAVEEGPVLLYLHGGAFSFRLPNTHAAWAGRLSRELRVRVLLPNYRLAPEHPYPAAVDDALAVYRWLLSQGVAPHKIIVGGESAGGNLTLALLLRLAQCGVSQPAAAFAISPVTDAGLTSHSYRTRAAVDPVLDATSMPFFRDLYVEKSRVSDPIVSPVHGHYRDLPPILIQAGTREILLDDACRTAQRIHESGGRVSCEIWEDMPHAFPLLGLLKESRLALGNIGRFVLSVAESGRT